MRRRSAPGAWRRSRAAARAAAPTCGRRGSTSRARRVAVRRTRPCMTRCQRQVSSRWRLDAAPAAPSSAAATGVVAARVRTALAACCRAVACGTSAIGDRRERGEQDAFFTSVASFLVLATTGAVNHVGAHAKGAPRPLSRLALRYAGGKVAARSDNRRPLGERIGHFDPKRRRSDARFRAGAAQRPEAGVDATPAGRSAPARAQAAGRCTRPRETSESRWSSRRPSAAPMETACGPAGHCSPAWRSPACSRARRAPGRACSSASPTTP